MTRFLHIADIHLGIKRYNLPDRTGDFFRAWCDVIERYALGRRVDFVIIAGDFFDRRNVDPQAANHAMFMLRQLNEARVPVVVIEGDHDQHESTSRFSWLRSFSQWRTIKLLEPIWRDNGAHMHAWNEAEANGSYIDIAGARVFGSNWYGSTVGAALPLLGEAARQNRRPGATNIMLLHSDVEGQLNRPVQHAVSISKLVTMRDAVDYLALGHTHKHFEIDGWAFKNSLLQLNKLKEQAIEELRPLGLIVNNRTIPKQLAVAMDLSRDAPRGERELRVIEDLIKPDPRFANRAAEIAALVIEAKRMALENEPAEHILALIEEKLFGLPEQEVAAV